MRVATERPIDEGDRMLYRAIATDYDGTLAEDGAVHPDVIAALEAFRAAGGKTLLVTGRELDELLTVCNCITLFDRVVAENGAVLYTPLPEPAVERLLAPRIGPAFSEALIARGVGPISCGRTIVATWEPHQHAVLDVIKEQGLELDVIFNKGAVMVLPTGINKATGLNAAAEELGLDPKTIIGIGDGENDHSLFEACGLGVAVANAVPALKDRADFITTGERGRGVIELAKRMLANDLPESRSAPRVTSARVEEEIPDSRVS